MAIVIEDYVPYDESLQWRLSQTYYQLRGLRAWNRGEVPSEATSNYLTARQHAEFLLRLVEGLEAEGHLGPNEPIQVLELGSGPGLFASQFMRSLFEGTGERGEALGKRLTYVMTDLNQDMLSEAVETPVLKRWVERGHVIPAAMDLCTPQQPRSLAGQPLDGPFLLVIANYIVDSLPVKRLRREGTQWSELYVSIRTGGPWDGETCPERILEIWMENADKASFLGGVDYEVEWRQAPIDEILEDERHRRICAAMTQHDSDVDLLTYPNTFFQFMEWAQSYLRPGAVLLMSDYGRMEAVQSLEKGGNNSVAYGNSLTVPVDFRAFDAYANEIEGVCCQSRRKGSALNHVALQPDGLSAELLADCFDQWFVQCQDGQTYVVAKVKLAVCRHQKDVDGEIEQLQKLLLLVPQQVDLYLALSVAYLRNGQRAEARAVLERGRQVPHAQYHDFDLELGRVALVEQDYGRAAYHLDQSVRRWPNVPALGNLGVAFEGLGRWDDAYRAHKMALKLAPTHSGLVQNFQRMKERLGVEAFAVLEARWSEEGGS